MTAFSGARILREPLVHFAGLSLLIFLAYAVLGEREQDPGQDITVTQSRIEQLSAVFARTWQRPPTPEEMKGLIDDFVKEEILVREARKLGLEEDDTVIRRRLRLKMEFLSGADPELLQPADTELQAYLESRRDAFSEPPRISFEQVYLSAERRGAAAERDAQSLLSALNGPDPPDASAVGDATLLPPGHNGAEPAEITSNFGEEFAAALQQAPENVWSGPLRSGYGLHLVRVTGRTAGRLPALAEIRDRVIREWRHARKAEIDARRMEELLKTYRVRISLPEAAQP